MAATEKFDARTPERFPADQKVVSGRIGYTRAEKVPAFQRVERRKMIGTKKARPPKRRAL